LFPTVYFGRHLGVREVEYFQAARVRVETRRRLTSMPMANTFAGRRLR